MIVVEVKLHSAVTNEVTLLGSAIISNAGTTPDGKYADYDVAVGRKTDAANLGKVYLTPLRKGVVKRHPRLSQNVWRLVLKALAQAFPEERVKLPDEDAPQDDPTFVDGRIDALYSRYLAMTGPHPSQPWHQPTYDELLMSLMKQQASRYEATHGRS